LTEPKIAAIADFSRALASTRGLDAVLHDSLDRVCHLLGACSAVLFLWNDDVPGLELAANYRMSTLAREAINGFYAGRIDPSPNTPALFAFLERRPIETPDALTDDVHPILRDVARRTPFRGVVTHPIVFQGRSLGAF